jgi:hypothetical protein
MTTRVQTTALIAGITILFGIGSTVFSAAQNSQPETVMITFHAKPGAEAGLAQIIERHWETVRRLKMVLDGPHFTLRGTESGNKTYFIEVLSWRDASVPDSAPAEILAIWKEMNDLVEPRGGQPGLDISEVSLLTKS